MAGSKDFQPQSKNQGEVRKKRLLLLEKLQEFWFENFYQLNELVPKNKTKHANSKHQQHNCYWFCEIKICLGFTEDGYLNCHSSIFPTGQSGCRQKDNQKNPKND